MDIAFFVENNSKRLQYTVNQVFSQVLGKNLLILTNKKDFLNSPLPKINYSNAPIDVAELHIPNANLLSECHIRQTLPEIKITDKDIKIFPLKGSKDLDFDPLSAIFWLLSRYEEYLTYIPDAHQRFTATNSFAKLNNYLQIPIVDQYIGIINKELSKKNPFITFKTNNYQQKITFDIDIAFAYGHRPWWRNLLAALKNLISGDFYIFKERLDVLLLNKKDPFDTFKEIFQWHLETDSLHFFFLLANYGKFDTNIDWRDPKLQQIIKLIAARYEIGIHPSYQSNQINSLLKTEIQRLEIISGKKITHSRQHFLRLHLPVTYRNLIAAGITDDYSMGYADDVGFRAGTANCFFWYDLEKDEITNLKVHPFQVMDVTLTDYLKLSPEEAAIAVKNIQNQIKNYGGTFTTLWHNSSLVNDAWRRFYIENIAGL